jgi:hypothetical protein
MTLEAVEQSRVPPDGDPDDGDDLSLAYLMISSPNAPGSLSSPLSPEIYSSIPFYRGVKCPHCFCLLISA